MRALISKSNIQGKAAAPPSKSYTLRGLVCAALAGGRSEIINPLTSEDTLVACDVLQKIGAVIEKKEKEWIVSGGRLHQPDSDLYCGDSAGTLRFMAAVCSLLPGTSRLTAGTSLSRRPIMPLLEALAQLGINCSATGSSTPVTITGHKLRGGKVELPGNISSQYISALLFIAPLTEEGMTVKLTSPLESKPYVMMTLDCLKAFGIEVFQDPDLTFFTVKPQSYVSARYNVEGDWSSASYLLALGAVAGEICVSNLAAKSRQADREIWVLLNRMGIDLSISSECLITKKSSLKAFTADLSDCIDLLPTVCILAALAGGVSELRGIRRARLKESDRVAAMKTGLQRMGINIREEEDRMLITGTMPRGTIIDSVGDHRIAMAFSILGIAAGNTVIEGAECVSKTYPDFWNVLRSIGGIVELNG